GNMQDEIDRSLLTSRLDKDQIEDLYPDYPYDTHKPIVDRGAVSPATGKYDLDATPSDDIGSGTAQGATEGLNTQLSALSDTLDEIPALLGPNGNGIGSNSWVVSGDHTTTGKALLANDPHLAPMLPSLWYQMGLHCRELSKSCQYDTAGYTFSGMPGVIIGHNQDIAWGLT
ncbi:penicillin acylase family protein, partial [Streptomyces sp. SID8455]|nr:penicillin acylase family protein [Streptomyces sp. SID8455]